MEYIPNKDRILVVYSPSRFIIIPWVSISSHSFIDDIKFFSICHTYLLRIITHSPHCQVVPDCDRHCRSLSSFTEYLQIHTHTSNNVQINTIMIITVTILSIHSVIIIYFISKLQASNHNFSSTSARVSSVFCIG